jgi:hypothetical protein
MRENDIIYKYSQTHTHIYNHLQQAPFQEYKYMETTMRENDITFTHIVRKHIYNHLQHAPFLKCKYVKTTMLENDITYTTHTHIYGHKKSHIIHIYVCIYIYIYITGD